MKLNISYPATGSQKLFDIPDEHKLRSFFDKRIGTETPGDSLGPLWAGYLFKITGGNDRQGFPMKQGVLCSHRVRLLLSAPHSCFRPRRRGERRRKSVRGCVVDAGLSVLSLVVVRKGAAEVEGLTDVTVPRRLGPKRRNRIRKLFNLGRGDEVREYVVRRPLVVEKDAGGQGKEGTTSTSTNNKKPRFKAPKIQRLITPIVLQRKRHRLALKKKRCLVRKEQANAFKKLLAQRHKELKQRREQMKRRRSASLMRDSKTSVESGA